MSLFHINQDNTIELDKIFLCNRQLQRLSEIYPVEELKLDTHMNSNWEVSFTIHKSSNGIEMQNWDLIDDLALIEVENKGIFEIAVPKTTDTSICKNVTGISLGEAETGQTNITIEINTENDIAREDYVPTVLYNPDHVQGSALHRIFSVMPHYTIKYVDETIASEQRTFSCENTTVYDFLQQIAEELECIFVFDKFKREVSCYALENYGKDSGVFIDGTENLAETITITGDKDSVKNYFKIEGADDIITNRLGNRMIGGNHLWKPSNYQLGQMSTELQGALAERNKLIASYQTQYNELWDTWSKKYDQKVYLQSGMMPSEDTDTTTAESVFNDIFGTNAKLTYGCIQFVTQNEKDVARSLTNYAKIIAPSAYTVELLDVGGTLSNGILTRITFKAHVYLTDQFLEDGKILKDEYTSSPLTLPVKDGTALHMYVKDSTTVFTTDYYLYLKQQMDMAIEKSDASTDTITFDPPITGTEAYDTNRTPFLYAEYDNKADPEKLPYIHYTKYCIDRLESFYDAYEACSQILAKLNADIPNSTQSMLLKYITIDGSEQNIYEDLLGKYKKYMACISARKQYLQKQVSQLNTECESLEKQIGAIRDQCDMEKFLIKYSSNGTKLWEELCSFRREDVYKNENYMGQDMNETTLMENIDQLLKRAEEEIDNAREIHYTVSTTIGNLLLLPEFEPFWNKFELGNYIRIRVDEDIYKLRLISISCDYSDIAHLGVEFSDIVKERSAINDFKQIIQQANSVASSFNFVSRQAENGTKAQSAITTLLNEGLNVANTMIQDAKNQTFEMNEYGITGREWDDYINEYKPEQIRIVNNLLCFTDDAWEHTRTALGKIWWKNEWRYGLLAEVLVGKVIAGEQLTIENTDGSVEITGDGINITNGLLYIKDTRKSGNTNISVEINPNGTNFTGHNEDYVFNVAKNDNIIMGVTNEGNGYFKGDITATSLTLENCKLPYSSISDTPTIPTDITELTGGSNIMYKGDVTREEKTDDRGNIYYTYTVPTESGNYTYDVYERDSYLVFGVGKGDSADVSKSYTMVSKEGLLTAYNAIIYGTIYATKGEFSGHINGGTINIGDNFIVDENGATTAKALNIIGGSINISTESKYQSVDIIDLKHIKKQGYVGQNYDIDIDGEGAPEDVLGNNIYPFGTIYYDYKNDKGYVYLGNRWMIISNFAVVPNVTVTEYSTLRINPSVGMSIIDHVNVSTGDVSIGTNTDYATLVNSKGVKCPSVTTESLTMKSSSSDNNAKLVTGSIVVELSSSGTYTFSTPNISQYFPAYVCNGDANADSSRILSTSINATAQTITITYDNLGNTKTRLNYFYWEAVA